jgi:hypothetical protein
VDEAPSSSNVRELYRRLLGLGVAAGAPRAPSSTPFEHEPHLSEALHVAPEVADLTDAYVQVRYAERPPDERELRELERALERVARADDSQPG